MEKPERLDTALSIRYAMSRTAAKAAIQEGFVTVDGAVVQKPSALVTDANVIMCTAPEPQFVSRGGVKLAGALAAFGVDPEGLVCVDVGASTGGFTHCLLQQGASKVYAVDTGINQLAESLRQDNRVVCLEKTNINSLNKDFFKETIQLACVDVSFVSATKVMAAVFDLLPPEGQAVWLIKPQFEAGRQYIGKNGLIKNTKVHLKVLQDIYRFALTSGIGSPLGVIPSPITGGDGNKEFFLHFVRNRQGLNAGDYMTECKKAVMA